MNPDRTLILASLFVLAIAAPAHAARAAAPEQAVDASTVLAGRTPSAQFSFSAENLPIKQALALFARANRLNIVPDLDVEGDVTVDFHDLPLDLAMRALLEANGYYFVKSGDLIRVRNRETRLFQVDYINATRVGQGASGVAISSGMSSGGGGGGGSGAIQGSSMSVSATSTIDFWTDLAAQLRAMVGETGSVTVNSLSGTVLVSSNHRTVELVAEYLDSISGRVVQQVDIEVQIYEVGLSNQFQLGIDWTRIATEFTRDYGTEFGTGLIVTDSAFGAQPLPAGLVLSQDISERDITAVVQALDQQGDLQIVSKPRLRTLHNQPAVVRVGQDFPIFTTEVVAAPGTPPVLTTTITVENVTIGTVLSITPQIAADGLITLDITPAVSRLVRVERLATTSGSQATAPVIDIRQSTSLVRVRDGDTVVLGGLVQEGTATTVRKIPVLGDIPLLGRAFRGELKSKENTELVFFVTPRIVRAGAERPTEAAQAAGEKAE